LLRQNEALIEDLNNQLEIALEENITMQTEFEIYKQQNEETIIRKDQEIKDFLNDISNKEKIIQRLNDKRASIRELKQKFLIPKDVLDQFQRKLTTSTPYDNLKNLLSTNNNNINNNELDKTVDLRDIKEAKDSEEIKDNSVLITPVNDTKTEYPTKFMEIYRKSIRGGMKPSNKVVEKKETLKKSIDTININLDDSLLVNNIKNNENEKDNCLMSVNTLKDTIIEGDLEELEKEEKNKEENVIDETLLSDKKGFEDLVICDEKDFTLAPIIISKKENDKKRNKKIIENLKAMLAIIQMRKEALINHHILNRKIFEKMGFKMKR
jgi:hypothetical protein